MSVSNPAPSGRSAWVVALLLFSAAALTIPFLFGSGPGIAGLPGWVVALIVLQLVFAAAVWLFVRSFWSREAAAFDALEGDRPSRSETGGGRA